MAKADPIKAMQYLRFNISEVIDHSDAEQLNNVILTESFKNESRTNPIITCSFTN